MNILLLGATGRVGNKILAKAIADQHHVTALVRSPEKLTIQSDYLNIIDGNVLNEGDIASSMADADVVISALNTDKNNTLTKSMPLIIDAMKQHEISRIVTIGTAGILDSRSQPDKYRFQTNESKRRSTTAAEDHLAAYQHLKESDLEWTIVCPTYLPEGHEKGQYLTEKNLLPLDGKEIKTGDTAAFAYAELFEKNFVHFRVGIAY
ncbi:SDR family oxidoreductase [Gracilibacillus oryzae]|uniref:SDR family oxidoreductase n=1 Tax=Gracilibacillus oryzae TaxID=1672701 RepID=A0A7C8KMP2_9BACI|nr:SDR family oxidoreductase [Gracilibacillus oryzae]KAB8126386.1 SDR family oxidoreductase [Gracilibacillus oryzae]